MKKSIENIVKHSEVSEKAIERYLIDKVRMMGGLCLKYSNAGMTGYPDRVCLMPGGVTLWVELKSKGKKPTKLQQIRHSELEKIGHRVWVISGKQEVDSLIESTNKETAKTKTI